TRMTTRRSRPCWGPSSSTDRGAAHCRHRVPVAVLPFGAVTKIVAWRDPFCILSDDLGIPDLSEARSVGPKMRALSDSLVLGLAGPGNELGNVVAGIQRSLPAPDWRSLVNATDEVVDGINDRIEMRDPEPMGRFELPTNRLQGGCSTPELHRPGSRFSHGPRRSSRRVSDPEPRGRDACTLLKTAACGTLDH
ncbi:MAG: hypothetical protein QOE18_786, partial [Chloroflexota bacterium]|nr:hypothetical protein [Chloroflexota bacterium]